LERNLIQLRWVILPLLISFCLCCNDRKSPPTSGSSRQIERSVYHWKTTLNISAGEISILDSLNIKTIYLKFFDVDYDEVSHKPMPAGILRTEEQDLLSLRKAGSNSMRFSVIPTIFITNRCILDIDTSQLEGLVINMHKLIMHTIESNGFDSIPEIQFDCDWTERTKDKYFLLLQKFHALMPGTPLSATIRLHQVKFSAKTGIPPVSRGMLMAYNMGNLKDPAATNSILDVQELKKYVSNLQAYPLPLDVALPLFGWAVLFRNNEFKGLINDISEADVKGMWKQNEKQKRIDFVKDTVIKGYHFNAGDWLRIEESHYDEILAASEVLNSHLPRVGMRVALFHLDSLILKKYTTYEMESIYNSLH